MFARVFYGCTKVPSYKPLCIYTCPLLRMLYWILRMTDTVYDGEYIDGWINERNVSRDYPVNTYSRLSCQIAFDLVVFQNDAGISRPALKLTHFPNKWLPEVFPGGKRSGCLVNHSPRSSAKFKNRWSYISTSSYVLATLSFIFNALENSLSRQRFYKEKSSFFVMLFEWNRHQVLQLEWFLTTAYCTVADVTESVLFLSEEGDKSVPRKVVSLLAWDDMDIAQNFSYFFFVFIWPFGKYQSWSGWTECSCQLATITSSAAKTSYV